MSKVVQPKVYSLYDPPRVEGLKFDGDPGLTDPSHKQSCDIGTILAKYSRTGELPIVTHMGTPRYGDFSDVVDYQSALMKVQEAEDAFMDLPAKVRSRFENDPGQFLEFMADKKNEEEARSLGLLVEVKVPPKGEMGGGKDAAPKAAPQSGKEVAP